MVWIPKYLRRILRRKIRIFIEEHLSEIEHNHPDEDVSTGVYRFCHIHVVMGIPPQDAVSSIVGEITANLSRQLRLWYPELKQPYWGSVSWSPRFFESTVGLKDEVSQQYVDNRERGHKGQM